MSDAARHDTEPLAEQPDMPDPQTDALIAELVQDLRPVRRVLAPWKRTLLWFGVVLWFGAVLSLFADFPALRMRLMLTPDMAMAAAGALLTALLAAFAAFATSMPDRSPAWALLPLPAVLLWVSSSTLGCLRETVAPATVPMEPGHMMQCMYFLTTVSLPLGAVMVLLMLRAYPLRPGLTTSLAGLASAGAGAALLTLVHPFDATASDLLAHLAAVIGIVIALRFGGTAMLRRGR